MELEALVIYDSILFNRNGQIRRWADALERRFVLNSKQAAPKRSGELAAGIHGEVSRIGPKHLETLIFSEAEHTLYVLQGTTGPIMSNRMWGFANNPAYANVPGGIPRGGRIDTFHNGRFAGVRVDMAWMHAHGYALRLRPGNGFPEKLALSVSGQEANNFFAEAAEATARRHPSLRGFSPGYGY